MSLLNTANDGMPNVLVAICRYLAYAGPVPASRVIEVCAPEPFCSPGRARHTLNTWLKLGFLTTDDQDRIALPKHVSRYADLEAGLHGELRRRVLAPKNNEPFWGSEGVLSADFTRGLAWCLAIDPWRLHGNGWDGVNQLELETLPREREIFRNDTRWNGFRYWAVFLGFGWLSRYPKRGALVVDPTLAIRQSLSAVFAGTRQLSQRSFLDRLRDELPVLDGGAYRLKVERQLNPTAWSSPGPGELSTSLSFAMRRLAVDGTLTLEDLADSPEGRATLTGRAGRTLGRFSHVALAGGAP